MARSFNGTSDYLEHGAAVVSAVPITMACWCKTRKKVSAAARVLIAIGDTSTTKVYLYIQTTGDVYAQTTNNAGGVGQAISLGKCTPGIWNACAGVFASSTDRRVFLNGIKAVNTTSVVLGTPTVTNIGTRYTTGVRGVFMEGFIAEVAIWNVALEDWEVSLLSRGYSPDQIRPGSLKAYWPLTGQYSPNEIDLKGRFDATVFSAKPAIADQPPMLLRNRRLRVLDFAAWPPGAVDMVPVSRRSYQHRRTF